MPARAHAPTSAANAADAANNVNFDTVSPRRKTNHQTRGVLDARERDRRRRFLDSEGNDQTRWRHVVANDERHLDGLEPGSGLRHLDRFETQGRKLRRGERGENSPVRGLDPAAGFRRRRAAVSRLVVIVGAVAAVAVRCGVRRRRFMRAVKDTAARLEHPRQKDGEGERRASETEGSRNHDISVTHPRRARESTRRISTSPLYARRRRSVTPSAASAQVATIATTANGRSIAGTFVHCR